jgi:hypothetical protein
MLIREDEYRPHFLVHITYNISETMNIYLSNLVLNTYTSVDIRHVWVWFISVQYRVYFTTKHCTNFIIFSVSFGYRYRGPGFDSRRYQSF